MTIIATSRFNSFIGTNPNLSEFGETSNTADCLIPAEKSICSVFEIRPKGVFNVTLTFLSLYEISPAICLTILV